MVGKPFGCPLSKASLFRFRRSTASCFSGDSSFLGFLTTFLTTFFTTFFFGLGLGFFAFTAVFFFGAAVLALVALAGVFLVPSSGERVTVDAVKLRAGRRARIGVGSLGETLAKSTRRAAARPTDVNIAP